MDLGKPDRGMGSKFLHFGRVIAFAAALVGCLGGGVRIIDVKNPEIPHLLVEPLPLTVGVYYDPGFRSYQAEYDVFDKYVVKLGPASVAMFNDILPKMFKKVVAIDAMPPNPSIRRQISGILAPRIEDTTMYELPAVLSYVVTLYSPDGTKIDDIYVGSSTYRFTEYGYFGEQGPQLIGVAMRSIAAEFIEGFDQNPKVKKWLERSMASAGKKGGKEK